MAQNREKDETVDLQVPSETTLSLPHPHPHPDPNPTTSGCGSISLDPTRVVDRRRPRSDDDTPTTTTQIPEQKKRKTSDLKVEVVVVVKKAVNRCSGCRKRVGLTGFTCRCGDLFCAEHRYSDRHDCSFDYKTAGRAAIARENPVVRAAKLLKV